MRLLERETDRERERERERERVRGKPRVIETDIYRECMRKTRVCVRERERKK